MISMLPYITVLPAVILMSICGSYAQTGQQSFGFLHTPVNGRVAALGGYNVSQNKADVFATFGNPALLDSVADQDISVSYVSFYGSSKYSQAAYAFSIKSVGKLAAGLTYLSHGSFDSYDDAGNYLGKFNAAEYALRLSYCHQAGPFVMAIAPQLAVSGIAAYRSAALMADLGAVYRHPAMRFSAGLVVKNLGLVISRYAHEKSRLPFDVQAGSHL